MKTTSEINNAFYQDLGDAWWTSSDHMIAFLRAETAIRLDFIQRHLPPASGPLRILDLGAGGGLISIPLAQLGHHVTALDLSDSSLAVLNRKAASEGVRQNITTLQADITKSWFHPAFMNENDENDQTGKKPEIAEKDNPLEKFDVVLAMDILEHIPEPETLIFQALSVLKPKGRFIYHTLNQTWLCWLIYLQLAPRIMRNSPQNIHLYDYCIKPESMSRWLQQAGFTHHEQTGLRPRLHPGVIWQLLRHRQLDTDLPFDYCQSLALGYIGWAQLGP